MPLGKLGFCICHFSKTKSNPAKKSSEQCSPGTTKPTCQISAILEHFQNGQKIKGMFLPAGFQLQYHISVFVLSSSMLCYILKHWESSRKKPPLVAAYENHSCKRPAPVMDTFRILRVSKKLLNANS